MSLITEDDLIQMNRALQKVGGVADFNRLSTWKATLGEMLVNRGAEEEEAFASVDSLCLVDGVFYRDEGSSRERVVQHVVHIPWGAIPMIDWGPDCLRIEDLQVLYLWGLSSEGDGRHEYKLFEYPGVLESSLNIDSRRFIVDILEPAELSPVSLNPLKEDSGLCRAVLVFNLVTRK